ncbi:uncharacterized protein PHACADRAFT_163839 [Phanerochaete carnosa HHB-10118-sp]|uniref:Uncharacterized protein n=1 Tax=Phanerochaete carnosa (strain HHB-10118-sp) TaxID=650164 RepID=K5UU44_PHACS|nr:uncharacterized protein PHACADRAFT_163839 [Phanerochaete carnosa HHB-10118-sp]EKM53516.1 hypothetical protein PHACADRAFT_163839 [Phanerochaete carnosa HHB-10118-sp]
MFYARTDENELTFSNILNLQDVCVHKAVMGLSLAATNSVLCVPRNAGDSKQAYIAAIEQSMQDILKSVCPENERFPQYPVPPPADPPAAPAQALSPGPLAAPAQPPVPVPPIPSPLPAPAQHQAPPVIPQIHTQDQRSAEGPAGTGPSTSQQGQSEAHQEQPEAGPFMPKQGRSRRPTPAQAHTPPPADP